jgi:hypothetical protein
MFMCMCTFILCLCCAVREEILLETHFQELFPSLTNCRPTFYIHLPEMFLVSLTTPHERGLDV